MTWHSCTLWPSQSSCRWEDASTRLTGSTLFSMNVSLQAKQNSGLAASSFLATAFLWHCGVQEITRLSPMIYVIKLSVICFLVLLTLTLFSRQSTMALSLDDKLLGEKVHYYCSSSEDEADDNDSNGDDEKAGGSKSKGPVFIPEPDINKYSGTCTNVWNL